MGMQPRPRVPADHVLVVLQKANRWHDRLRDRSWYWPVPAPESVNDLWLPARPPEIVPI